MNPDSLLHITPEGLRQIAVDLTIHDDSLAHWSSVAVILGRVDDGQLWKSWEYASTRAWAESELGIPPNETVAYLDLWTTMQSVHDKVGFDGWTVLSKAKARLVRKIINAKGDPATWLAHAASMSSA